MKKFLIALFVCLSATLARAQCTAVDNFTGSGNLGSPNWTQTTATSIVNGFTQITSVFGPLAQSGGVVTPAAISTLGSVTWTNSGCVLPSDQYAQVTLNGGVQYSGYTGPTIRSDNNGNGYVWSIALAAVFKMVNYHLGLTVVEYCPAAVNGDTYRLAARGTAITAYQLDASGNVIAQCQGGDPSYTSGVPGFMVDQSLWTGPYSATRTYNVRQIVSVGSELYFANQNGVVNLYPPDNLTPTGWTDEGQTPTNIDAISKFQAGYSTLAAPQFSYVSGTYGFSPVIKFHNDNLAAMCYTTNGSTPTAPTAGTCGPGSTTIAEGGTLTISATTTLSAITTKALLTNSGVTTSSYTIRSGPDQTWYVRKDGGTRFSTNITNGQCDGTANVSYVSTGATTNAQWFPSTVYSTGTIITDSNGFYETATTGGTSGANEPGPTWGSASTTDGGVTWTKGLAYAKNQHCAFNDFRMLFQDGSSTNQDVFPGWGWIGAGGDTYMVEGSVADGVWYSVGWDTMSTYCTARGCWGALNNPGASAPGSLPSGDPTHHTRLLGGNYLSCQSASLQETRPTPNATQLRGRWATGGVINLGNGAQYTDLACLDITDNSACVRATAGIPCKNTDGTVEDFATNGLQIDPTATNVTLTNIRAHGLGGQGVSGSPGNGFVATDFAIVGNPGAGWNADDGSGRTGVGTMHVNHFDISWSGCGEEFPIVDPAPYQYCTDQNSGGYGDGFGTSTVESEPPGWQVFFTDGVASYNTQDGLDALHIAGIGSTLNVNRVLAYGSEGQQIKVGGAQAAIYNSLINGNCEALALGSGNPDVIANDPQWASQPRVPGTPVGFGDALSAFCRGSNTAVLINLTPGDPGAYQGNVMFSENSVGLEVEYATFDTGPTNTIVYNDNVFVGFRNNVDFPSVIFSNTDLKMFTNPGASMTNNSTIGQKVNWTCPNPDVDETNAICASPQLVDMTYHASGYGEMVPIAGSPLLRAGVAEASIPIDYLGVTRTNPPTIGAYDNPPVVNTITITPASASQVETLTQSYSAFCAYSDGFTNPCTVTWTGTGNHSTIQTLTGPVTSVLVNSVGTDTITGTISTVFGTATITGLPIPPFNPFRGAHIQGAIY